MRLGFDAAIRSGHGAWFEVSSWHEDPNTIRSHQKNGKENKSVGHQNILIYLTTT